MELPHIGQTCVVCNRNDYLPFRCSHCDKTVCVDHKTNHGSECPLDKSNFEFNTLADGAPVESLKKACDYCKKITLKLELVECNQCARNHCLYHRHQVQHECSKLAEVIERRKKENQERKELQQEALQRLKDSQKPTQTRLAANSSSGPAAQSLETPHKDPKKKALEKRVRIMRIKSSARGPSNILSEDKLHFEVKFQHQADCCLSKESLDNKTLRFYTTAKHTIGRMVDWSASELGLINKNNVADADELTFMKATGDQKIPMILDSQVNFQHYLESEQLEDGDELIMKYYRK